MGVGGDVRQFLVGLKTRRPGVFEVGSGVVAGGLALIASLVQWGVGADGLFRGLSLGVWLGALAWFVVRRRRTAEEEARRAVIEQRLQLARELHDTVAGQVSVIGIQAAAARRILVSRPDEAALALERIELAGRSANADLRRMLDALRGNDGTEPTGAAPGLAGLEDLVAGFNTGVPLVTLDLEPGVRPVRDAAVDRAAYRIVQEALTNARRHAGDVPVRIDLRRDGLSIALEVVNGPGTAAADPGGGLGLVGIRERATLLGGMADAGPTADGGFAVRARLPLGATTSAAGPGTGEAS
jgi:signal transduction histidine kinase